MSTGRSVVSIARDVRVSLRYDARARTFTIRADGTNVYESRSFPEAQREYDECVKNLREDRERGR